MENVLKDLIDKTYELEGLVLLVLKRKESSEEIRRLISKKGSEIGELCKSLYTDSNDEPELPKMTENLFSLDEYSIDEEKNQEYIPKPAYNPSFEEVSESRVSNSRGKLVFSINDRYRFKKELFNNSDVDFNNTVALIASMENYEEAEDYFINEEGFDPGKPVVKDFLEIIKRYFL